MQMHSRTVNLGIAALSYHTTSRTRLTLASALGNSRVCPAAAARPLSRAIWRQLANTLHHITSPTSLVMGQRPWPPLRMLLDPLLPHTPLPPPSYHATLWQVQSFTRQSNPLLAVRKR